MNKPMRKPVIFTLVALAVLSPLLVTAIYVDDWSRDLTTNTAVTSAGASDATLRPLVTDRSTDEMIDAVMTFLGNAPSWLVAEKVTSAPDESPLNSLAGDVLGEFHLVRTTGVLGWKDDVWVVLEERDDKRIVHVHSQSRVGKGDLGQNPRNIRELLAALQQPTTEPRP